MTEKELKNLSRKALLELLLVQTERADKLEKKLASAEKKLESRTIALDKAGTMAEAAILLNGIFESADNAAKLYLENIKRVSESQSEYCKMLEDESRERARLIIAEAERKCLERESLCEMRLAEMSAEMRRLYSEKRSFDELYSDTAVNEDE